MKILNTIVFYDNKEEVKTYIEEVASIANDLVDVILVINSDKAGESKDLFDELKKKGIMITQLLDFGENVGYLNTLLKTIQQINVDRYDYIILSNTDIHYETKSFFDILATKTYPKNVGCIAPCVFATKSNSYSNPHYAERIPKAKLKRNLMIFKHPLLGRVYLTLAGIKARKAGAIKKSSCYVYSPHGCYMIFTRRFIEKILGYEYGVKLYSEESAIGELLLQNGMRCYYDDSIGVVHQESSVTGQIDYKKRFRAWSESLQYILMEFY